MHLEGSLDEVGQFAELMLVPCKTVHQHSSVSHVAYSTYLGTAETNMDIPKSRTSLRAFFDIPLNPCITEVLSILQLPFQSQSHR